jgi:hypothetical protein
MQQKVHRSRLLSLMACAAALASPLALAAPALDEVFANPPQEAKPRVMWMWMGRNVTKEGITRDLEALKDAGFGGSFAAEHRTILHQANFGPVTGGGDVGAGTGEATAADDDIVGFSKVFHQKERALDQARYPLRMRQNVTVSVAKECGLRTGNQGVSWVLGMTCSN